MGHEMGCRSKKGSGGEYPPLLELSQQKFTNIVPWKKCCVITSEKPEVPPQTKEQK